jgi:cbb3-type cytochrome oxidase maturation protein
VNIIAVLLPVAVALALLFLTFFLLAARDGQFEDLDDPPRRILKDDD